MCLLLAKAAPQAMILRQTGKFNFNFLTVDECQQQQAMQPLMIAATALLLRPIRAGFFPPLSIPVLNLAVCFKWVLFPQLLYGLLL